MRALEPSVQAFRLAPSLFRRPLFISLIYGARQGVNIVPPPELRWLALPLGRAGLTHEPLGGGIKLPPPFTFCEISPKPDELRT